MILANPVTGAVFRWREILKRLATQQSRNALPQVRQLAKRLRRALRRSHRAAEARRGCGWVDRRSIQDFVLRAAARQRSRLEHGGRCAAGVSFDAAADAVGLLQAAVRAGHESADRSAARVAGDVARGASCRNGVVLPSPIISAGQLAELSATFGPVQEVEFHVSCPNGSFGRALQHYSADYPSEWQRAPGTPPPFRSRHQRGARGACRRCWRRRRCGRRWCATDCGMCR